MRRQASALLLLATASVDTPAAAQGWSFGHMWGGGWSMFFGPRCMTLLLALAILLIVGVARWYRSDANPRGPAERILEERFARGEIDKKKF